MQNGQNPWGCASDDILELFKSEGVLDYRYDSHGDISDGSANTIRCGIHVLLNYCEYGSRRGYSEFMYLNCAQVAKWILTILTTMLTQMPYFPGEPAQ